MRASPAPSNTTDVPLATQLTIRLGNDIGVLARLCRDLSDAGVNLLGLSAHQWGQQGVVRLLVVNQEQAKEALRKAGYRCAIDQVLFAEIKNRPGALAKTVEKLARARINIESAYATAHLRSQKTVAVIAVDASDLARALKLLG